MPEPRYGCAEEALLRRVASPKASPKGPQGAARERVVFRGKASVVVSRVEVEKGREFLNLS